MSAERPEPIVVEIRDPGMGELALQYLVRRREQLGQLRAALASGDMETIAVAAHKLRGSGGAYGFDEISRLATGLRDAVAAGDRNGVRAGLDALGDFLDRIEVRVR